jgi:hypothetical protein
LEEANMDGEQRETAGERISRERAYRMSAEGREEARKRKVEGAGILCGVIRGQELCHGKQHRLRNELYELLCELGHTRLANRVCR